MEKIEWRDEILDFWKKSDAFKQSIEQRSADMAFTFFDGPPFTSGDPHYGHLLQSIVKDMVPRWMTMRGYRVPRVWGWDCHGIPAENFVNKKLGISSKKEVEEEFGIRNYIEECRTMVSEINTNRSKTISKIGRWVDMDNAYFTMDNNFMESVIHVFSDLYNQGLIYKGFKVLGYSWALGTALSNSEIAEGYEMRQDPAVTISFPLRETQNSDGNDHEFVAGILKDEAGRQLMLYHHEDGRWFFPGGKIDAGELPVDALKREIQEELGVKVTAEKFLGGSRFVHTGNLWKGHFFEIEVAGTPEAKEDTHSDLQWVETLPSSSDENDLDYAIKVGDIVIDDSTQIRREFMDWYFLDNHGFFEHREAGEAPVEMLAWTTTPWTLPSNMFTAVGGELDYVQIYHIADKKYYILAEAKLETFFKDASSYLLIKHFTGDHLVGIGYEPLFDCYHAHPEISETYKGNVHKVLASDFVTVESGTGIVHEAPAFGEDDYNLVCGVFPREHAQDWLFDPIDVYGDFTSLVPEREGVNVIEANKPIVQALKESGRLFKLETIDHSYPHCPRTKTPLIYKAIESWFLKEDHLKASTVPSTQDQYFVPDTVKKRFVNGLETAPDWNISRTRFWGCPLPVWENKEDPDERVVVGSIAEIYELNKPLGQITQQGDDYVFTDTGKLVDLHRPYIDDIQLIHPETGNTLHRIPEVLDCWFESGSMPYGQIHRMKNDEKKNSAVPSADFIAEGLDQTRGWFRALHVLANGYTHKPVFKNVVVTGMILAEDGKKMSKSLKNYPDPTYLLDQYGADPLRLYMLGSPVVKAEPLRFNEQGVEQMLKDFVIPVQNVWNFLKTYAEVDGWADSGTKIYFVEEGKEISQEDTVRVNAQVEIKAGISLEEVAKKYLGQTVLMTGTFEQFIAYWKEQTGVDLDVDTSLLEHPVLLPLVPIHDEIDQWIYAELHTMMLELDQALQSYTLEPATRILTSFIEKLTNRYVRRSRRRFWAAGMEADKLAAYHTLWTVLETFMLCAAPFVPFVVEKIWLEMKQLQNVDSPTSIHLEYWPFASRAYTNDGLIQEIEIVRKVIKGALYVRAKNKVKVKQPLQELSFRA